MFTPAQILARRQAAGLTQAEAAAKCKVERRVWQHYEAGTRKPSRAVETLIAKLK